MYYLCNVLKTKTNMKDLTNARNTYNALQEMKAIYEIHGLTGGFYNDMMDEINLQIKHVETVIENLQKNARVFGEATAPERTGRGEEKTEWEEVVCISDNDQEQYLKTGKTYYIKAFKGSYVYVKGVGDGVVFRRNRFIAANEYKKSSYPTPKEARYFFKECKNELKVSKTEAKNRIIDTYPALNEKFDLVEGILNTIYNG